MIAHMEDEKANIEKKINSVLGNDCFESYFFASSFGHESHKRNTHFAL